ncbi:MAG: hypothetical protein U1E29_06130 [Coriobacteriia bacterium]|nr:hypothetical protein [Coriobacteriia bacterium]
MDWPQSPGDLWLWAARAGSLASIVGLPLVFREARRAKTMARRAQTASAAAEAASQDVIDELNRQVLLTDLTHTADLLTEALTLLRIDKRDLALLRISDALRALSQLRYLPRFTHPRVQTKFQSAISRLAVLISDLEGQQNLDIIRCSRTLHMVSNQLNEWIGKEKYADTEEAS